jgi:hypothetical protein
MMEERGPVSEERQRRVGHNEALYRSVNERIEELNETFGAVAGDFSVVCECGDLGCMEQIRVARDVYEHARASSHRFIVKPGHEMDDVEDVVETHLEYVLVEKAPATSRRVAEDTDPRR